MLTHIEHKTLPYTPRQMVPRAIWSTGNGAKLTDSRSGGEPVEVAGNAVATGQPARTEFVVDAERCAE